ncbi:MAG: hypothetical protein HZB38_12235 [Planctomycetes bacterium]|nr:hypothetical protein [Planctomycetota bacterium]
MNDWVRALSVFDSGSGPALYAGGGFTDAGGVVANRIAKWNGAAWSALGSGLNNPASALTVFDDGSGPALFAGGTFSDAGGIAANYIAKWNGSSWSPLGSGITGGPLANVRALAVFDDGGGLALYAGGDFYTAGGVSAGSIAKWDGSDWSPLGAVGMDSMVYTLCVFGDAADQALYAGGTFRTAGGVSANYIAKWNGSTWSALGSGMNGVVNALSVFDDGRGPALFAGGDFPAAGGVAATRIARWSSSGWSALGNGMSHAVYSLAVMNDGSTPSLYAGGLFTAAGGALMNGIARWNGGAWSSLASGMSGSFGRVVAMAVFDDGGGPALFAGGAFTTAGVGAAERKQLVALG